MKLTNQTHRPAVMNNQTNIPAGQNTQADVSVQQGQSVLPDLSQQSSFNDVSANVAVQQDAGNVAHFAQQATTAPSTSQSLFSLQMAQVGGAEVATQAAPIQQQPLQQPSLAQASAVEAPTPLTEAQRNEQVVQEFYAAMEAKDFDKIMSLYHPDAVFTDPAFPNISGEKLENMWKLITGNEGLVVETSNVKVQSDGSVTGHWDADYELIKGNPIKNSIDSKFEFKDGKIIKHTDSFDFAKWADQAIPGIFGKLAGTSVGKFLMQKVLLPFAIR